MITYHQRLPGKLKAPLLLSLLFIYATVGIATNALAEPYYKNKTIRSYVSYPPGGRADQRVRAMIPFLEKYTPGNPKFIVGYMPPDIRLGNYMARGAKRDGLTIALLSRSPIYYVLKSPGVQYNLDDFIYLGSVESGATRAIITRKEVGLQTVEQLRAYRGLRIGSTAVGSGLFHQVRLVEFVLGLQGVRWLAGYSTPETELALERGEIDALTTALGTIPRRKPEWYKDGAVQFHVLTGPEPTFEAYPELKETLRGIPRLTNFADTPLKEQLLDIESAASMWMWILPRGVPERAATELYQGLEQAFKDQNWIAQHTRLVGEIPDVTPRHKVTEMLTKLIQTIKENPMAVEITRKLATSTEPVAHP